MTARQDFQTAELNTAIAVAALAALNARITDGDATVTGADLMAAEAAVTVAGRLQEGAAVRAVDEQAAANVAATEAAVATAKADYATNAAALTTALESALAGIADALAAASTLLSTTQADLAAVANLDSNAAQALRNLPVPTPNEVLDGLVVAASQANGLKTGVSYPHINLQPIQPFLNS